jgi:hypothetical protein
MGHHPPRRIELVLATRSIPTLLVSLVSLPEMDRVVQVSADAISRSRRFNGYHFWLVLQSPVLISRLCPLLWHPILAFFVRLASRDPFEGIPVHYPPNVPGPLASKEVCDPGVRTFADLYLYGPDM